MSSYHEPVMLKECLSYMQIEPEGTYVDATFGGGGHSQAILKILNTQGRLIGLDQDPAAATNAPKDDRFTLVAGNFRHLKKLLRLQNLQNFDGLLADFGVSSHQLDEAERGFSLRFDAELDMRMNPDRELTARAVVNNYSELFLKEIFRNYGELRNAGLLAKALVEKRPLSTTGELKDALSFAQPKVPAQRNRFWAQVFQAIRIEVNDELQVIEELLAQATEMLKPGGRMVCLSYHSLEDRIVKNIFRYGNSAGEPVKDFYGNLERPLRPLTPKPLLAEPQEVKRNPRARSAKLRAAEKLANDA